MRKLEEKSYSMREALTMAIENCESQDEILIAIKLLKQEPTNEQEEEERFNQICIFIKENMYNAKYCNNCKKWFFEDYYKAFDTIYNDERQSCIFCILDDDTCHSLDFTF